MTPSPSKLFRMSTFPLYIRIRVVPDMVSTRRSEVIEEYAPKIVDQNFDRDVE